MFKRVNEVDAASAASAVAGFLVFGLFPATHYKVSSLSAMAEPTFGGRANSVLPPEDRQTLSNPTASTCSCLPWEEFNSYAKADTAGSATLVVAVAAATNASPSSQHQGDSEDGKAGDSGDNKTSRGRPDRGLVPKKQCGEG